MLSYDDWADALYRHFFRDENAGHPLFLFVDDDLIGDLAGTDDTSWAVDRFVSAVRSKMGSEEYDTLFKTLTIDSVEWFDGPGQGAPRCLPLLASMVLAASRMAADGNVATNNYYVRYRDLMHLPGRGRPRGFDWASSALWPRLRHWLDVTMNGALGRSTIPEHPSLRYVGPPISQALWRTADRLRFFVFLTESGRRPGAVGEPDALVREFMAWAADQPGLGRGVRLMIARKDLWPILREILEAVSASWDGSTQGRRQSIQIRLLLTRDRLGRAEIGMVARRPPGESLTTRAQAISGEEVRLNSEGDWYTILMATGSVELDRGVVLDGDSARFVLDARPLHILMQDSELGGWVGGAPALSGMPLRLLVRDELVAPLTAYLLLAQRGDAGPPPSRVVPGWILVDGVELRADRPPPQDGRLASLSALPRDLFEFVGGLRLDGPSTYLIGGEPDVKLARSVTVRSIPVLLDGRLIGDVTPDTPLPLRAATHELGDHRVTVGSLTMPFVTTDRSVADGVGAVPIERLVGALRLSGVLIAPVGQDVGSGTPIVLPRHGTHALLGASPGQFLVTGPWARPGWMSHLGLDPTRREVWPTFPVVWVVMRDHDRRAVRCVERLDPNEVAGVGVSTRDLESWRSWLLRSERYRIDPGDVDLWTRYVVAARAWTSR